MRRTKEEAAETRREILRSAEALFLDNGYENVTLDEIASAAGVTRGAVHWHFKNKQGLLFSIRDKAQQPFQELAERIAEGHPPNPLELLIDTISATFAEIQQEPRKRGLLKVIMYLDMAFCDDAADSTDSFRHDMQEHFARIFHSMDADKPLPPPWSADTAASALTAVIGGLVAEWALDKGDFELVPCGQALIKMILTTWFPTH
ncbi:TetR family transcriptional regulator (plasmid) [Rhizobium sp. CB3060]|uniref:TetR family transcriptional regulator n=1 Tax=unclassified Rhizobium TaxID=2613769 RepID=UPI0021A4375C|nr:MULTISPECIES: TetR family transcriptional regulator [Rhizobium]MDK4741072.1 TetR family transcriptional regulator [Rhizobium sp. CNPSo 3464]UWU24922.1 TetR family transcriptional regulator [Rhizobium tropici]